MKPSTRIRMYLAKRHATECDRTAVLQEDVVDGILDYLDEEHDLHHEAVPGVPVIDVPPVRAVVHGLQGLTEEQAQRVVAGIARVAMTVVRGAQEDARSG